jgi:hypothetical protein
VKPAQFFGEHDARDLPRGRYRLLARLGYYSPKLAAHGLGDAGPCGDCGHVWMEIGFEHDGYSAPWFAAPLVWRANKKPAAVHDKLCGGEVKGVGRALADEVILEAMECVDMDWAQRRFIYRGTRIGDRWNIGGQGDETVAPEIGVPPDSSPGA